MTNMRKPMDLSKFRKGITKSIDNISYGLRDPSVWIDTGSYTLNYMISGDFFRGIPLGKVTTLAGRSGSGKSYIATGNIVREAQKMGLTTIIIDSENAIDKNWLVKLGVDPEFVEIYRLTMIDDVAKLISEFMKMYKEEFKDLPESERPGVLFVIDSLGALLTPTDVNQFQSGEMKGDLGRKAKQLKALVSNCTNMFGDWNVGLVATNHSYASLDSYNPDDIVSGGSGFEYMSSIVVTMKKGKLKEDDDGNKTTVVNGIRAMCRITKNRFNHKSLFKAFELKIPFESGLDPYSGLFELFEASKILVKEGNRYKYISPVDGTEIKEFRKNLTNDHYMKMMLEFNSHTDLVIGNVEEE